MVNKLQIVRIDNLSVRRVDLQIGNNIIGRGAATGIVDNPIAEHAVTINIEPTGEMTITPMLACYMKSGNSSRWQSLKIGTTVPINIGDICSLLPDKSWFKITSSDSSINMDDDSPKRKATNSSEEEPPDKKLRKDDSVETIYSQSKSVLDGWNTEGVTIVEESSDDRTSPSTKSNETAKDTSGSKNENSQSANKVVSNDPTTNTPTREQSANESTTDSSGASKEAQNQNRDDAGKKIKWDCGRHFSDQTDQSSSEITADDTSVNSTARPENNPTAEATVSSDEPMRNKCTYGSQCYRRNSEHKRQFSHPGDPDYDIPDTRPECPYGVKCYRKNPQHKIDFKHTNNRPSRAQTPIRGAASEAGTSGTEQSSAEESVDESDYEPSCNGETSDDYRSDLDGALSEFEGISDCEEDK